MNSYLIHKNMGIIHRLASGIGMKTVAIENHITMSGLAGVLRAFNREVGCPFAQDNATRKHQQGVGTEGFFKALDEAALAHKEVVLERSGGGSFMLRYGLNDEFPFMHPAIAMILMVSRGDSAIDIIGNPLWDYRMFRVMRMAVGVLDPTQRLEKPNQLFRMTRKIVDIATQAEELLPYNKALYAEAQNLPKLAK